MRFIGYIILLQYSQNITFLVDYFTANLNKRQDIVITVLLESAFADM